MRIAVVSDIHGNLTALDAVIADVSQAAPDLVVCGGDLVGGGSSPAEVVDRVRGLGWPAIQGNTDEMLWMPDRVSQLLGAPQLQPVRDMVLMHVIPATRRAIGEERLAWLRSLPSQWSRDGLTVVHAAPDDLWRSPAADATDEELARVYGPLASRLVVYGHIHCPYVRRLATLTVANSGSVSLSYDGDPRSAYVLIDGDDIVIRRVHYDIEEEVRRLSDAHDPYAEWTAQVLRSAKYIPLPQ
jgi:predicted phosphodiesterase